MKHLKVYCRDDWNFKKARPVENPPFFPTRAKLLWVLNDSSGAKIEGGDTDLYLRRTPEIGIWRLFFFAPKFGPKFDPKFD